MKNPDRLHRPDLDRTYAVRSFSTLFGAPRAAGSPPDAGAAANGNGPPSLSDVVSHSVDLGYRIIDDYVRQGEKAARRLSERSATPQTMVGDAQDVAARFAQHASGLAAVWLEFLQLTAASSGMPMAGNFWEAVGATTGAPPPSPSARPQANGTSPRHADTERTRVRIEVVSNQPTEVVLDLQPSAAGRSLTVHVLRAVDPDKPRIDDVAFQPESDTAPACVRVCIPAGQPAGVYNGLIIDEASSRPVGSVSVSVGVIGTGGAA